MSDTLITVYIVGGMLAVGGLLAARRLVLERRRREALTQLARRAGWTFAAVGDAAWLAPVAALPLFQRGRGHAPRNVVTAGAIASCDYAYTTGSGKSQSTTHQTVAVVNLGARRLPAFTLQPEFLPHKLGALVGYHDIDFAGHETFSKQYWLRGTDAAAIRALWTTEALRWFAGQPGWCVEGAGARMAVYRSGRHVPPEALRQFLDDAGRIAAMLQGP